MMPAIAAALSIAMPLFTPPPFIAFIDTIMIRHDDASAGFRRAIFAAAYAAMLPPCHATFHVDAAMKPPCFSAA
jgi:hypothetical protein